MRSITVPGDIELLYARDPDFFHGMKTQGKFNQVGSSLADDKLVGIACRTYLY